MDDITVRPRRAATLLGCRKFYFRMETEGIVVVESFGKQTVIRYEDISALLFLNMSKNQAVILLGRKNERLLNFSSADMINADKAIDILRMKRIPSINLSERLERWQDIDEYMPALSWSERFVCRPQVIAMKSARRIEEANEGKKIEKWKRLACVVGWAMFVLDIFILLFLRGGIRTACFMFVLLFAWAMYVWMYPLLFLEVSGFVKNKKYIIEMPVFGILAAFFFCLTGFENFACDFGDYLVFVGIITVLLLIPLFLKSYFGKEKPDKMRVLASSFLALLLAYAVVFPVNYMVTFQADRHEPVMVKSKEIYVNKFASYYVYADWKEADHKFTVSEKTYYEIQKGDRMQVCLRHSIFGFHYWILHNEGHCKWGEL